MTTNKKHGKDDFGSRIKQYEAVWRQTLPNRMPVIIRLDGRAFHTYTKGCNRPFDSNLDNVMNMTAIELCKTVSGAQIAYVQSDEISILVHTYKNLNTQAWFDNQIQKMCSISAAVASTTFTMNSGLIWNGTIKTAIFDSRVFVVPETEVNNVFLWRQKDSTRNSISMLAQSLFSQKELNGKNSNQQQEMCFQKGRNWNDLPTSQKRGRCIIKEKIEINGRIRTQWCVDDEIPVFSANKDYIQKYLATEDLSK